MDSIYIYIFFFYFANCVGMDKAQLKNEEAQNIDIDQRILTKMLKWENSVVFKTKLQ